MWDLRRRSRAAIQSILFRTSTSMTIFFGLHKSYFSFPDYHDYVGLQPLYYAVVRPIPRALWHGKPASAGYDLAEMLGMKNVSLTQSIVGELYASHGFLALLIGGFVFGRLAGMLNNLLTQAIGPSRSLIYGLSLMALFASLRSIDGILRLVVRRVRLGGDRQADETQKSISAPKAEIPKIRLGRSSKPELRSMKIAVLTCFPSPYQLQLFDSISGREECDLSVVYVMETSSDRSWELGRLRHDHCFLSRRGGYEAARKWIAECDLAVFNWYRHGQTQRLMSERNRHKKAWVFWGERPGFLYPAWIGRCYRIWALRHLHASRAPIWGIGQWAVSAYRDEFGSARTYVNFPYCSDLGPFFSIERNANSVGPVRFLYSGSLSRRKGVDLLLSAFAALVRQGHEIHLHVVGEGPLGNEVNRYARTIPGRIHAHGFRQWNELADIYKEADVLCAPSRYDGWALTVPEGLASGMPVVTSDHVGAALDLIDGENGWIVSAGSEQALLKAMREAASLSCERRRSMSIHARQSARSQHVDVGAKRFLEIAQLSLEAWAQTRPLDQVP